MLFVNMEEEFSGMWMIFLYLDSVHLFKKLIVPILEIKKKNWDWAL